MKIFVTGSNGLVGSYLVDGLLAAGHEVFASSRNADLSVREHPQYRFVQLNFTDPFALHDAFNFVKPEIVVHAGAMSKPDDCEMHQAEAYDTNMVSTVQLLLNAEDYQSFFVFISTDFVFDGQDARLTEYAATAPVNYYGKTKLDAEEAVSEYPFNWAVVRTSFVYGKPLYGRPCFITMIGQKLKQQQPYKIVHDQIRTPTHAADLADGILRVIEKRATGIFHIAGADIKTPYEMAMEAAQMLDIRTHQLTPVASHELKASAQRPLKAGLNIAKAQQELGYSPVSFSAGIQKTLF